jgi:hypothetical protein
LIAATIVLSIVFAIVISVAIITTFYVGAAHNHQPSPAPATTAAPHAIFAANSTGAQVVLTENSSARNVTYSRLREFLSSDHTEDHDYVMPNYTCSDFARQLHDRAESAGIVCGYVSVVFEDATRHAIVVFNTTDRGTVYIDETKKSDAEVHLVADEPYGWTVPGGEYKRSIGDITDDVYIYW